MSNVLEGEGLRRIWRVGPYRLDFASERLTHGAHTIRLRPKTWAVLQVLVAAPGRLVTKRELLDKVWEKTAVEEKALNASIGEIRRAFGDSAREPRYIETVHRRGFRFVARLSEAESGDSTQPAEPVASGADAGPFVGREQELERLRAALADARFGRGRTVLVSGPAGVGKSRIVRELLAAAGASDSPLLGRCVEGGGVPYFPWIEMIRTCMRSTALEAGRETWGVAATELTRLVPALAVPETSTAPAISPDASDSDLTRLRLFEAIGLFLERVAAARSLVIVLEDLHWADPASLRALRALAPRLAAQPLLLLLTLRPDELERDSIARDVVGFLSREPGFEEIRLEGLAPAAAAELVRGSGSGGMPEAVLRQVVATSQGNPFFIQEILRHLGELSLLDGRGEWRSRLLDEGLELPTRVLDVFERRVRRLSPGCRKLLDCAAVIGADCDEWLLATALEIGEHETVDGLEEAMLAGILVEPRDRPGHYRFGHDLMRAALYQRQIAPLRRHNHLRVADAIEALRGVDDESLPELAFHLAAAVPTARAERALDATLRAAEAARRRLAYESEAELFRRALALAESSSEPALRARRCELEVHHAEALRRAGDAQAAGRAFRRAIETARRDGASDWQARAALGAASLSDAKEDEVAALLEEGLERLGERDSPLRTRLLARLAAILDPRPDTRVRCEALSREAEASARRIGDPALLAETLMDSLMLQWYPGNLATQAATCDDLIDAASRAGDPSLRARAHLWRAVIALSSGDVPLAERAAQELVALAQVRRLPQDRWCGLYLSATVALVRADLARAESLSREAYAIGQSCTPDAAARIHWAQMSAIRREQNRGADLLPVLEAQRAENPNLIWVLPFLYLDADQIEPARAAFRHAWSVGVERMPADSSRSRRLVVLGSMAHACAILREADAAPTLYELIEPYEDRWAVTAFGDLSHEMMATALGALAGCRGRWKLAAEHFERAADAYTRAGAIVAQARNAHVYARVLLDRGRPADREHARELIQRGMEIAQRHDLVRTACLFDRLREREAALAK